jgi:uncharacterized RDD family membrane protein YckC
MTNPYAPPRTAVQDIVTFDAQFIQADLGTRLGAAILDSIIFMAMVYLPILVGAAVADASRGTDGDGDLIALAGFGLATVGFVVWCWLTILYMWRNGQSIAKRLVGIKVVRTDGSTASLGRLIWLRNVLNTAISIIPLYSIIDVPGCARMIGGAAKRRRTSTRSSTP